MTQTKLSDILPAAGWNVSVAPTGPVLFAPSEREARRLSCQSPVALAKMALKFAGHTEIVWAGCTRPLRVLPQLALIYSEDINPMIEDSLPSPTAAGIEALVEKIEASNHPRFLVDMVNHRNFLAPNEAGLALLGYRADQAIHLLEKSLPGYWSSAAKPNSEEVAPPKPLTDLNSLLIGQRFIEARYENWREDFNAGTMTWTRWRTEVELIELPDGTPARLMTCLEWEAVPLPLPV